VARRILLAVVVVCLGLAAPGVAVLGQGLAAPAAAASEGFDSPDFPNLEITATVENGVTPAVTFVDEFAGYRQTDPYVCAGCEQSEHLHAWLATPLPADVPVETLWEAPFDPESGTLATALANNKAGSTGMFNYDDGTRGGITSGVWWPAVYDAPPGKEPRLVDYVGGIARYYVRRDALGHAGRELQAMPNGLRFIMFEDTAQFSEMKWDEGVAGQFKLNMFGPAWWNGKDLDSEDHYSHVSNSCESPCDPDTWVPIPQFQVYVKGVVAYPEDDTPLAQRLRFGHPHMDPPVPLHIDYVFGNRHGDQLFQHLLDEGPNQARKLAAVTINARDPSQHWPSALAPTIVTRIPRPGRLAVLAGAHGAWMLDGPSGSVPQRWLGGR